MDGDAWVGQYGVPELDLWVLSSLVELDSILDMMGSSETATSYFIYHASCLTPHVLCIMHHDARAVHGSARKEKQRTPLYTLMQNANANANANAGGRWKKEFCPEKT